MEREGRILIVDGDPRIREAIALGLKGQYRLLMADTGHEAVDLIRRGEQLDLIILEYKLPNMSGLETLRAIKALVPSILVIMITAFGSEELCAKAFGIGIRAYFKKPLDIQEFISTVQVLLHVQSVGQEKRNNVLLKAGEGALRKSFEVSPQNSLLQANPGLLRAVKYLEESYGEQISLDAIAGHAHISKYHFSRLFTRFLGISFKNYLTSLRIKKAKEMLTDRSLTITEISQAVGYNDLSQFERVFRKMEGRSPSVYRKSFGSGREGM